MTNDTAKARQERREAMVDRILDCALELTLERLENIEPKEKKDNMIFDRVARTAQVLIRIADDADSLAARKRKEQTGHDQSGADADEDARIEREAAALQRRLDKYIDGLSGGAAARDGGADGAPERDHAGVRA